MRLCNIILHTEYEILYRQFSQCSILPTLNLTRRFADKMSFQGPYDF